MPSKSWLLRLPRELRDEVYGHVFIESTFASVENGLLVYYRYPASEWYHCGNWEAVATTWLFTCKQIFREAIEQFYRRAGCCHFHPVNKRAKWLRLSPFTVTKIRSFNLICDLKIWSSEDRGFIGVDTRDRFEQEPSFEDLDDEELLVQLANFDLKSLSELTAFRRGDHRYRDGFTVPGEADADAVDEGSRRFREIFERRDKLGRANLAKGVEVRFDFPMSTADHQLHNVRGIKTWELHFGFLKALGTSLERVSLAVEESCLRADSIQVEKRHLVSKIMQRDFTQLQGSLRRNDSIPFRTPEKQTTDTRHSSSSSSSSSTCDGLDDIEWLGLSGFIVDVVTHQYYFRVKYEATGQSQAFEAEDGQMIVIDNLPLPGEGAITRL